MQNPIASLGIHFSIENKLLTLTLNTPLHRASPEQLLSFDRLCDVSSLFKNVFGVADHIRWLVSEKDKIKAQFISAFANKYETNHHQTDMARKVASMLYMLQNQHNEMLYLNEQVKQEICEKAPEFLKEQPLCRKSRELKNCTWTNIRAALALLDSSVNRDSLNLETIDDSFEKRAPTACNVFCNSEIIRKQLISAHKLHYVLINSCPYVNEHVMIVPKECRRQSSERNAEEVLEKFQLILRVQLIFKDRLCCHSIGVCTREGALAGQTQPHLHDHVLGFNPQVKEQLWVNHWRGDFNHLPIDQLPAVNAINRIKEILPSLFSPIKAIVFDIGGVVVKQFNKELKWLKTIIPNKEYEELFKPLTESQIDEDQFWLEMGQEYGFTYDQAFRARWKEIYLNSNPIAQKVIDAINKLRSENFKIYALSNTIPSHFSMNQERGLFDSFDGAIHSHLVGVSKPGLVIYEKMVALTGLKPEELLFMDDRIKNVEGAQKAGMHAFLWNDEEEGLERIDAYINLREEGR